MLIKLGDIWKCTFQYRYWYWCQCWYWWACYECHLGCDWISRKKEKHNTELYWSGSVNKCFHQDTRYSVLKETDRIMQWSDLQLSRPRWNRQCARRMYLPCWLNLQRTIVIIWSSQMLNMLLFAKYLMTFFQYRYRHCNLHCVCHKLLDFWYQSMCLI